MKQGLLRGSRYSPGNMDRASLEALFVGRSELMGDVLARAMESISSRRKHYLLLIGPRGSGKTHLLALAYHRLMEKLSELGKRDSVAIAFLNEEEWGVASYLDLVVRILKALCVNDSGLSDQINEIYERFPKDPSSAEAYAIQTLRDCTNGKTLVLLCENLVDLFQGLGEEGQKRWRTSIQEDGNWTIVATTPSLFDAIALQDNPFYGFFTLRNLEQISFETSLDLLAQKAVHENKTELAGFLRTPLGRARARAIHHLAAGNHRAYVVLFDFLDKESLEDLIHPFMHMVDDLTPYYQDKMRQLAPAQRKILEFLCLQGAPRTVKEVATQCLMSQQTAAKQIGELDKTGFVNRLSSGRNTFCELSEPLMRICIEVKENNTQHFRLFVDFLRHWFTTHELERRHEVFQSDDQSPFLDRVHIGEAVRCAHAEAQSPFVEALSVEAENCLDAGDYGGLATVQRTILQDRDSPEDHSTLAYALVMADEAGPAIKAAREGIEKYPEHVSLQGDLARACFIDDRLGDALNAINRAIELSGERPEHLCMRADILLGLERFDEAIADALAVLVEEPDHWHSYEQIIKAYVRQNRLDIANTHVQRLLELAPDDFYALLIASRFYSNQGRLEEALEHVSQALELDIDQDEAIRLRGSILFVMGRYGMACEDLKKVETRHSQDAYFQCLLARSLLYGGEYEEAIKVAGRLIEIDPSHAHAHYVCGKALVGLSRPADAIGALNKLLQLDSHHSLLHAASLARKLGEFEAAKRYLHRVSELQPDNRDLWCQLTSIYIDEQDLETARECAAEASAKVGDPLLGRVLQAQVSAATDPLQTAFELIEKTSDIGEAEEDIFSYIDSLAQVIWISVCRFGPRYFEAGLVKLRDLSTNHWGDGVLGGILTQFLKANAQEDFPGSLSEWESALEGLAASTAHLPECRIPVGMLKAVVAYSKTGEQKHLLGLPLEQRRLLEEVLP